jgi:predicted N-formylglutamate amidohydrolase
MTARLLLTCEHGGNAIPATHRHLFASAEAVLASHRGWDPGSLDVARTIARVCGAPLLEVRVSRLLVDANRSPGHPRVFSTYTRALAKDARDALLARYHAPHHRAAADEASSLARQGDMLHLSIHSFTPSLDGRVRNVDLGLLYDPARSCERRCADALSVALSRRLPGLRIRRNAPYRGVSDGLTKVLRRKLDTERYAGLELEISQRFLVDAPGMASLGRAVAAAVAETMTVF